MDTTDKKTFLFPVLCIPLHLKPTTIFWILTLSDVVLLSFSCFIVIVLMMLMPTWYIILSGILYLVIYCLLSFLFLDIVFVNWRSKTRQTLLRSCKYYTVLRYLLWSLCLVFHLSVIIYMIVQSAKVDTSNMYYKQNRTSSLTKYYIILLAFLVLDVYMILMSFQIKLQNLVRFRKLDKAMEEYRRAGGNTLSMKNEGLIHDD